MSHTVLHHLPCVFAAETGGGDSLALLQLRHLTKNALQRLIAQIAASDLRSTPAGSHLADELEDRICLSARLSDQLFGFTASPGALPRRLQALVEATVQLLSETEQTITTDVSVTGSCTAAQESTIVRVAHEMVGNAVKHGMAVRLTGRIVVRVRCQPGRAVTLLVSDNGWGPREGCDTGEGMTIMHQLAGQHGGTMALYREDGWTVARLHLPA